MALWNYETWGDGYLPTDVDDVIAAANEKIKAYAKENNLDVCDPAVYDYSSKLWDKYCMTETI